MIRGEISLGEMSGREARSIKEKLDEACVEVEYVNCSRLSYLPVNKTRGFAWLIEDDEEAEKIALEMIASGAPINDCEA